ncbi:MAG: anaerobic sulfatase maturase [Deltaproteobacteria bacterium]|nr:anaerobic sulfatase maturase [Deltaproteobacteria bacterium]
MARRRPYQVVAKPIGPACNLDCRYCYYLDKKSLYPERQAPSDWEMPDAVLESFIRQKLETSDQPLETFCWQGGEPTLLGAGFFRKVLALQREYAGGRQIENSLQTNGILLDDDWCRFLADSGFLVGISIDGPREMHDAYRIDLAGKPTFDRVVRGVELLRKHGVQFNTLTAVHDRNARHPLEVYAFLEDLGSRFMQFIPIVERAAGEAGPSERSVEPGQLGAFLIAVFDHWVRHDVGARFVQLFDVSLQAWCGIEASLCLFSETCGRAPALESNGDLYACDHFVFPEYRLGNILRQSLRSMVESRQQAAFGARKRDGLPRCCRECEFLFACRGGCPRNRFSISPDGEPGLNSLCAGYRQFFAHVEPYMRFMAGELRQRRSPARVMAWARDRDARALRDAQG